jgi:hypothetical protein
MTDFKERFHTQTPRLDGVLRFCLWGGNSRCQEYLIPRKRFTLIGYNSHEEHHGK